MEHASFYELNGNPLPTFFIYMERLYYIIDVDLDQQMKRSVVGGERTGL
jgi:hypothetical protein